VRSSVALELVELVGDLLEAGDDLVLAFAVERLDLVELLDDGGEELALGVVQLRQDALEWGRGREAPSACTRASVPRREAARKGERT
jgi:hypothetical protein